MGESKRPRELIAETLELVKKGNEIAKQAENTALTEAMMTARENLQFLREKLADLQDERKELEAQLEELKKTLSQRGKMVRSSGVYFVKGDADPWCPKCWEAEQKALHLNPSGLMGGRLVRCTRCDYSINLDNVTPPKKWPDDE